eukprot:2808497-Prymnesium_polylepis.1
MQRSRLGLTDQSPFAFPLVQCERLTFGLLRADPLGLRFSGRNMSPLPGWLSGAQNVALNMSNTDVPVQLHFALFTGSDGFRLKPPEMRSTRLASAGILHASQRWRLGMQRAYELCTEESRPAEQWRPQQ